MTTAETSVGENQRRYSRELLDNTRSGKLDWKPVIAICLVAILWTVVYNRRFLPLQGDAADYEARTLQIASGHLPASAMWRPFYTAVAAILVKAGLSARIALSAVSLIAMLSLLLLVYREGGWVPMAITAVSPALMLFGIAAVSEMLFALLFLAAVILFLSDKWLLASLVTFMAFETRYAGISLLLFMFLVLVLNKFQSLSKLKALILSTLLIGAGFAFNKIVYGTLAEDRPRSTTGVLANIHDLGAAFAASWIGDAPLRLPVVSWIVAVAALSGVAAILVKTKPGWALAVLSYCVFYVTSESLFATDHINRRVIMPMIPLLILCAFWRSRRYEFVIIAVLISLPHLIRGVIA